MKAAIVGAGLAGLRLAGRLAERGLEVTLFEKARGPSGRLSTRRGEVGPFDHGAQYLTVRDPRFRRQVEDWLGRGVIAPWSGRIVRFEAVGRSEVADGRERFVGRPRMSALARDLADGHALEASTRIVELDRKQDGWTLRAEDGRSWAGFDLAFAAVPAPQAVPLLAAAPRLRDAAAAVEMAPCHAVMVAFSDTSDMSDAGRASEATGQPRAADFDGAFVDRPGQPLAWLVREASKPGRPPGLRWVLHSRADWSAAHVDDDPDDVARALLAGFEALLGTPLPAVEARATHRWLYARVLDPRPVEPLFDPALGLGACGDWTRGDRVEDAFLSGDVLAEAVLGQLFGARGVPGEARS